MVLSLYETGRGYAVRIGLPLRASISSIRIGIVTFGISFLVSIHTIYLLVVLLAFQGGNT